jgi:hypothetical protein
MSSFFRSQGSCQGGQAALCKVMTLPQFLLRICGISSFAK